MNAATTPRPPVCAACREEERAPRSGEPRRLPSMLLPLWLLLGEPRSGSSSSDPRPMYTRVQAACAARCFRKS